MDPAATIDIDDEIDLIASSLLPSETLNVVDPNAIHAPPTSTSASKNTDEHSSWPRHFSITSTNSNRSLWITVEKSYPLRDGVVVQIKSPTAGREEADQWRIWAQERMKDWDDDIEYPLFQLLTQHFLPLLAPASSSPTPPPPPPPNSTHPTSTSTTSTRTLHHVLVTSHHLLSPTKRKNLLSLSSQLSLTGFSKVGHPGIYYAVGEKEDLVDWLREVKSWNWLALRVRVAIEPVRHGEGEGEGEGEKEVDEVKKRGDWVEVDKIGEALEWLKKRGREKLLLNIGMGGG